MPILTMSVKCCRRARLIAPFADGSGESGDLCAFGQDVGHHVVAVDDDRPAGEIAQGHVQRRTLFGRIDLSAGKQRVAPLLEPGIAGEVEQMAERRRSGGSSNNLDQVVEPGGKALETLGSAANRSMPRCVAISTRWASSAAKAAATSVRSM